MPTNRYSTKRHTNIKGELRIKTCTEIAIRDGLPSAKEYCIKNLGLSESAWEHTYKQRVMQALIKNQTKHVVGTQTVSTYDLKTGKRLSKQKVEFVRASEI